MTVKTTLATVAAWMCAAACLPAQGANLSEIYALARANDAQFAAATQAAIAGREKRVQGRALLRPTIGLSGAVRRNHDQSTAYVGEGSYSSGSLSLNINQPLVRPANLAGAEQGELQAQQADQQLRLAEQDLQLRVARGYFEVLQASDALATLSSQKETFATQLAQAKRSFEVGLSPITDVNEAQSRYDLTVAQEIAARNELEVKRRTLEKSINADLPALASLDPLASVDVVPADLQLQLSIGASQGSLPVALARLNERISESEVRRQQAGHWAAIDLVGSYTYNRNANYNGLTGGQRISAASVGLEVAVPLYQGGAIDSRVREALANQERALAEIENARRQAILDGRQALLGVQSGIALELALRQAIASGETQVRSTRRGLEVGVRTRVDLLNAEQQLFTTRRDWSAARYQTLIAGLQLKAAAGALAATDLAALDALLKN